MPGLFALYRRLPPIVRGIGFMLVSTVLFSLMQAFVRIAGTLPEEPVHPFEVAFFRNLFALVFMLPLLLGSGLRALRTTKIHLHALRGLLQTAGMMMTFLAMTIGKLSDNIALSFTAPLYTFILAVLLLGEKADWQRWAALIFGFLGVVVIVQPGSGAFGLASLLVLASSVLWGFGLMSIKFMARTDSSLTINLYMGLTMVPLSLVPALFVWTWPSMEGWLWLGGIGLLGALGHLTLAQSFREADATAVLPFDFLRLIWAALFGLVFFSEMPSVWTLAGGVLIFGAATFIALREARLRAAARAG